MKTFSHFSEDIASRRKVLKQRQIQQAADFKDRTTGAHQRAKDEAVKKAAYREKVKAEVRKEIEDES
tara:strand:- start:306 stop:506 length:201 start_codon:yes stop_codon:yes gene_type:complete